MAGVVLFCEKECDESRAVRTFLQARAIEFTEIDLTGAVEAVRVLHRMSGSSGIPQVFISDTPVGGYDQLVKMAATGDLDRLLTAATGPRTESTWSLSF